MSINELKALGEKVRAQSPPNSPVIPYGKINRGGTNIGGGTQQSQNMAIQGTLDMPPINVAGDICYSGGTSSHFATFFDYESGVPVPCVYPSFMDSSTPLKTTDSYTILSKTIGKEKSKKGWNGKYDEIDEETSEKWIAEIGKRIKKIVEISKDVHDRFNRAKKLTYIEILKTQEQISYLSKRIDIDRIKNENLQEEIINTNNIFNLTNLSPKN
jgi:hypothetical protein